jgi:TonB family protein
LGHYQHLYGATGILFIIVLSSSLLILLASVAGRDVFQMPAQQQAVDVSGKPKNHPSRSITITMTIKYVVFILTIFSTTTAIASDTLYFKLSNPWNTVKSSEGKYLRKCVKENDFYHAWDFNSSNQLVVESFYSDTNFTKKLFCHKYFNESKGFLEQTRCYENGRLHGYFVGYNSKGDTTSYQVYDNGALVKSWSPEGDNSTSTFTMNEEHAEFPGGRTAWLEYLSDNLKYPKSLKKEKISGQVLAKVFVDANGVVNNVEILKSLHPLLDEEVVRVIKKSPKWKPAKQNGKNVQMTFTQPISF